MKIGIDCRLYQETGIGRYIRNLIKNLEISDKKNDYVLFALSKDIDKFNIQNPRFKIVKTDIKWHTLSEQLRLPQILNKENLDLMHFPYFSVPVYYKRPFVVTIHDLIINHFSTGKASTLPPYIYNLKLYSYKFVLSQAAKNAKKIIAVSNSTKTEITDHLKVDVDKVAVTYEGIDPLVMGSKAKLPDILLNKKYFLYVGNAYPHKNLDRLLKAFKTIRSDVNLVLVVKRDYFYQGLKRNVDDLSLSEKVIFLHAVRDEELSALYKNAIALVFPSLMEGFGLPVLEAMANNCLVLTSDIPSLKEICVDGAVYFDPYVIQDMAEKMNKACLSGYPGKKEKALERSKTFSWEKMARETIKVYESCFSL
jgi:glycosyltransferase involved in cell wall biosynthesis